MASARAVAVLVVSGTAVLAAAIAGLAVWVALTPSPEGMAGASSVPSVSIVPPGYVLAKIGGVAPTPKGNAVVLTDPEEKRGLLIFVGGTEGLSLALRLQNRRYDRPLTHDLLDNVLGEFQGTVLSAHVDRLSDGIFFGTLLVSNGRQVVRLDSRPSDALALAIGSEAPIYVARQLFDAAGVDLSELELRSPADMPTEETLEAVGQVEL